MGFSVFTPREHQGGPADGGLFALYFSPLFCTVASDSNGSTGGGYIQGYVFAAGKRTLLEKLRPNHGHSSAVLDLLDPKFFFVLLVCFFFVVVC